MDVQYMEIGPVPYDESCAQVGEENFRQLATAEMNAYIEQMYRLYPDAHEHIVFEKKWFNHDFGSYGEVCIVFDADDDRSCEYAYNVERNLPQNWDDEALEKLRIR